MLHVIRVAASVGTLGRLLQSAIATYDDAITQLVQDAAVGGRTFSLLHGLHGVVNNVCRLPEDDCSVDPGRIDAVYQRLVLAEDLLAWLASAAVRDFCQLVTHTTTTMDDEALSTSMVAWVDLRADISAAMEQRRFPPAIVAESVFAQYVVETKLDLALERAVVNTVVSGLPPNPFVALCAHLRVFASQQWSVLSQDGGRLPLAPPHAVHAMNNGLFRVTIAPNGTTPFRSVDHMLVAANGRLLASINVHRVLAVHHTLRELHVYRTTAIHPTKATYTARVVHLLLLDDPLLDAAADDLGGVLLQSIDVVERVVIEGKEFALALQVFAEAVRRDAVRLQEEQSMDMHLVGPSGDALTAVELHDVETFQQLLVEATPKQCVLRVVLPPIVRVDQASTEPIVRLVRKTYVFQHQSPESSPVGVNNSFNCLGDALARRLCTFGVGIDTEAVPSAWDPNRTVDCDEIDVTTLTEYAARASQRNDTFLIDRLRYLAVSTDTSASVPRDNAILLLRLLDMERALEWLLHRLVFQQQTSLTPRSETAELAADAKVVLTRVASVLERVVVPFVETMGMVDARRVVETIASVRSFCGVASTVDAQETVATAERLTRHLWTLVLVVRFSSQADSASGREP